MKAVGLYKYLPIDNPESLIDVDIPKPEAGGGICSSASRRSP